MDTHSGRAYMYVVLLCSVVGGIRSNDSGEEAKNAQSYRLFVIRTRVLDDAKSLGDA